MFSIRSWGFIRHWTQTCDLNFSYIEEINHLLEWEALPGCKSVPEGHVHSMWNAPHCSRLLLSVYLCVSVLPSCLRLCLLAFSSSCRWVLCLLDSNGSLSVCDLGCIRKSRSWKPRCIMPCSRIQEGGRASRWPKPSGRICELQWRRCGGRSCGRAVSLTARSCTSEWRCCSRRSR